MCFCLPCCGSPRAIALHTEVCVKSALRSCVGFCAGSVGGSEVESLTFQSLTSYSLTRWLTSVSLFKKNIYIYFKGLWWLNEIVYVKHLMCVWPIESALVWFPFHGKWVMKATQELADHSGRLLPLVLLPLGPSTFVSPLHCPQEGSVDILLFHYYWLWLFCDGVQG